MAFERSKLALNYVGNATGLASTKADDASTAMSVGELHIVDQLIAERGKGLASSPMWPLIRPLLYKILHYHQAVEMADHIAPLSASDSMNYISRKLSLDVQVINRDHIPREGAFIVVCNHPTGIADGVAMWDAMAPVRPDLTVFANRDAIRVCRQFNDVIIPVEWREEYKTREKSREALRLTSAAIRQQKAIVVFPSGRIAYWAKGGLNERDWQTSALALARKHKLPVLPAHMSSRNSGLFYWLAKWSTELRDMTVFHELLNKQGSPFEIAFGPMIQPEQLLGDAQQVTDALQHHCTHALADDPNLEFKL